jgi:single-stranded-DNA-specific exonuclease
LLKDMGIACDLIAAAVDRGDRIAVYGDYDADGVTAAAVLARGLRAVGGDVLTYIPNRFSEGYGLNIEALRDLHARGTRLVISCDCGTNSLAVARQRPADLRLIVTDHHEVGSERPPVDALINPKQPDCRYPFDGLAACGVAYKLLVALERRAFAGRLDPAASIDAVALGTVADVVPLRSENRALVKAGLEKLNRDPSLGCAALMAAAGIRGPVTAEHLAFQLAPRINAAGRMEDAVLALELFLAETEEAAQAAAEKLQVQNAERQRLTAEIVKDARAQVLDLPDDVPAIVLGSPEWPLGVIGLAASRLVEEFYRPAFVFNLAEEESRGSARSIDGLHLVDCLDACAPLLLRYGGHAMAAGMTVRRDQFGVLAEAIRRHVASALDGAAYRRSIKVEAKASLADLKPACTRRSRCWPRSASVIANRSCCRAAWRCSGRRDSARRGDTCGCSCAMPRPLGRLLPSTKRRRSLTCRRVAGWTSSTRWTASAGTATTGFGSIFATCGRPNRRRRWP